MEDNKIIEEKIISGHKTGGLMLFLTLALYVVATIGVIYGGTMSNGPIAVISGIYLFVGWILFLGLKVLKPNEALVLTLFGKYVGTLKGDGFFFVNPFVTAFNPAAGTKLGQSGDINGGTKTASNNAETAAAAMSKKISLKVMTLSNSRQKVNDVLGNPVEVAVAVMWRVNDTAKAVFAVDNYKEYLSLQCDAAVRNVVKIYPYDVTDNVDTTGDGQADDGSLRGSTELVANRIKEEIQDKVKDAGLEIVQELLISLMLQRLRQLCYRDSRQQQLLMQER